MTFGDPTPRLLAAMASLTGTGILMCRTEPSWEGILIGLLCLGLWALATLAARPTRPRRPARPRMLEAVIIETPLALLPAPRPAAPVPAPRLLEAPTQRQRAVAHHTRRRR